MTQLNVSKLHNRKIQFWKNKILLVLGVVFISSLASCEKDQLNYSDSDSYYVKYEVSSSTIYIGGKLDVRFNSEANTFTNTTINQRQNWEVIVGPVSRGFNAQMHVSAPHDTHDKLKLYTNIYVSKNNGPFAIKEINGSDSPRDQVSIGYTIDF